MARATHAELAQKARFIFEGTVRTRGAATMESAPVTDKTLVVHIERIVQAPKALNAYLGKDITVQVVGGSNATLREGRPYTFYANGWLFGQGIAVRSVGHLPVERAERAMMTRGAVSPDPTADPQRNLLNHDLQQRVATAQAVVTGRVREVRLPTTPVEDEQLTGAATRGLTETAREMYAPISEHDPQWREAVIEVEGVEKGTPGRSSVVVVRFPSSRDVQWYRSPKFEPGQEGVFLLHQQEKAPATTTTTRRSAAAEAESAAAEVYTVVDPADFQPRQQLQTVKTLLTAEGENPREDDK